MIPPGTIRPVERREGSQLRPFLGRFPQYGRVSPVSKDTACLDSERDAGESSSTIIGVCYISRLNCWPTARAANPVMARLDPAIRMEQLLSGIASFTKPMRIEMATTSPAVTGLRINPFGVWVYCWVLPCETCRGRLLLRNLTSSGPMDDSPFCGESSGFRRTSLCRGCMRRSGAPEAPEDTQATYACQRISPIRRDAPNQARRHCADTVERLAESSALRQIMNQLAGRSH